MYARQPFPPHLRQLAERQAGMITTAQMIDGGLTRPVIRRLTSPWTRLINGLYCTSSPTWLSAVWAGLLAGGEGSAVGGAAALYLDEILRDPPQLVTVWSTEARANLRLGPYSILLRRGQRKSIGTLPRTPVETSLLDMADHASQDSLTDAVVRAFTGRKTTAVRLLGALNERGRNAHRGLLTELCLHGSQGIESVLEWHFRRNVLEAHGLPVPELQPASPFGRSDGLWQDFGVRLELDGVRDHQDVSRDWFRDNDHLIHNGEVTLRYGWNASVREPCRAAAQVAVALRSKGWEASPTPCKAGCPVQAILAA